MEISTVWNGGRSFTTKGNSGYDILMDATPGFKGEGNGNTPVELLLGGLAGCIGIDVTMILNPHIDKIESLTIDVDATRSDVEPKPFTAYTVSFHMSGSIEAKKVLHAIKLGKDKYCSVSASLNGDITYELILNGETYTV